MEKSTDVGNEIKQDFFYLCLIFTFFVSVLRAHSGQVGIPNGQGQARCRAQAGTIMIAASFRRAAVCIRAA